MTLLQKGKTMRPCFRASRLQLEPLEDRCLLSSTIIDLGPGFVATSVNNAGLVAGTANGHAALWRDGALLDLGTLGGAVSRANDVNDAGQVVGAADTPAGVTHAFLLNPEDTDSDGQADRWFRDDDGNGINDLMRDLDTLGGRNSEARGINNLGQVVGRADTSTALTSFRAFLWDSAGGMVNLGTAFGAYSSEANAINDHGQVAGTAYQFTFNLLHLPNVIQGFSWDPVSGGSILGGSFFPTRKATAINDTGRIVGTTGTIKSYGDHMGAPRYYGATDAFVWQSGTSSNLGLTVPPTPWGQGFEFDMSINRNAQVVGLHQLWQEGVVIDLNSLVDFTWNISRASDINDFGRIVGVGTHGGVNTSFLLTHDAPLPPPSIAIRDASVTETSSGVNVAFKVELSRPAEETVTVDYSTLAGSATADADFTAISGTVTFAPGETSKAVSVNVLDDRFIEPGETFLVNLTSPVNATLADGQAQGTILDDEPRILINSTSRAEGNTGATTLTFFVSLLVAYDMPVTVDYATSAGTAAASSDYQSASGTLSFAPGERNKVIDVLVNGDRLVESDESFHVNLSNLSFGVLLNTQATGTIGDDEPRVWINSAANTEGNSGTNPLSFRVDLSAYDIPVTVAYATSGGTATANSDYQSASGTLTFAPGETSKTITVAINGDRLGEADELFYVNLSNLSLGVIANGQGTGTLWEDEPRLTIGDVTQSEGAKGSTTLFTFTVSLSMAYDQAVTLSFKTVNGAAKTSDGDYIAKSGTITFNAEETTKTITIEVKGDSRREKNEAFYLDLFGNSSNSSFAKSRGIGTILNDD